MPARTKKLQMQIVATDQAPLPIGPYSQAQIHNGLLFCSGQLGVDPLSGALVNKNDVEAQARQMLLNLRAIAEASGTDLTSTLKCTLFLKNMSDFSAVNKIYAEFFKPPYPARSTIAVAELPMGGLCEIEAIMALGKK